MPVYFPPLTPAFSTEEAQDAVGSILVDSATIDFTYNDATPSITAIVIDESITFAKMQNIATARLLGRDTAGSGDIEELTAAEVLALIPHATLHEDGGSDPVDVTQLDGFPGGSQRFLREDGTFAVPGSTPGSSDPFEYTDRSWEHQVDLDGLAYSSKGVDFTFTLSGASAIVMDSDARWIRNTPNLANIGEATLVQAITGIPHRRRWHAIHVFRGKTYNDISSQRIWIGFADTAPQASDTPAGHLAGFRYSTGAGDTNWMACHNDNATFTATSTGVAVATDTMYLFRIELDTSEVRFYIDGTLVHTASSNLPGIDDSMGANVSLTQLAASARSILYSRQFVRQRG